MKLTVDWLRQHVTVEPDVAGVARTLTMLGIEVGAVHPLTPRADRVCVGRIAALAPHPQADRLVVCQVDIGADPPRQIVCGASNMVAGDRVPVALPGAVLAGGLAIREARLRGVPSQGMLCSEQELGLPIDSGGLWILPETAPVGAPLAELWPEPDWQLELEVTPNRPDCLSVLGVAREYAAATAQAVRRPATELSGSSRRASDLAAVAIEAPDRCRRYLARVIEGVRIGPSPQWLRWRLLTAGLRPINNVVDVTNFVLLESGHPLHAFDLERLAEHRIVVRRAAPGEAFLALDGRRHLLDEQDLVIADGREAVALAGIIGGEGSEITPATANVLLESAWFLPAGVRATARRLGIATESAYRFERGTDLEGLAWANARATSLFVQVAGGAVAESVIDVYPRPYAPHRVRCRTARAAALLGVPLTSEQVVDSLTRLELPASVLPGGQEVEVSAPSFRHDLEIEADLIEEVGRLYGLDRIPAAVPRSAVGSDPADARYRLHRAVRRFLTDSGLDEAVTYSLLGEAEVGQWRGALEPAAAETVRLANPLIEEQTCLRASLLPSLVQVVAHNLARGSRDLRLFEVGRVYWRTGPQTVRERVQLGIAFSGRAYPAWWSEPDRSRNLDFFDVKGGIERLAGAFDVAGLRWRAPTSPLPAPLEGEGAAEILAPDGGRVGLVARLEARRSTKLRAPAPVWLAELDLETLGALRRPLRQYGPLPQYPAVTRDMALVVAATVTHEAVEAAIRQLAQPLLESVRLFDLYAGAPLGEGRKSLAYALTYRAADRTLTDDEVNDVHQQLVAALCRALEAELRGPD